MTDITTAIPATVHMISGCQDSQTSADVSNVASFKLPDPAGRAGGACTSAFLNVVYADEKKNDLTFVETLMMMRKILSKGSYSQVPQLSSSRPLDVNQDFYLVPPNFSGTKRALLIGINYVGMYGELRGCHNDVYNIKQYIMDVWGFEERNITILMDDGKHDDPTRGNILGNMRRLASESQSGDAVFCHYSGHGGKVRDNDGDEKDGYDETLIPMDYTYAGQIRDDDLFTKFIGRMPAGAHLTCLMDCCHSGTVLDLPYKFKANGENTEMVLDENFDMGKLDTMAAAVLAAAAVGTAVYCACENGCCAIS